MFCMHSFVGMLCVVYFPDTKYLFVAELFSEIGSLFRHYGSRELLQTDFFYSLPKMKFHSLLSDGGLIDFKLAFLFLSWLCAPFLH